jgi:mono/diheme cytochrome c family protein
MKVAWLSVLVALLAGGCTAEDPRASTAGDRDEMATDSTGARGDPSRSLERRAALAASEPVPSVLGIGRTADHDEIALWDTDVRPDGTGLPVGRGTHSRGAALFAELCASCHGKGGQGTDLAGPVVSASAELGFRARVTGHFWPYSTTLYDYIRRSMPQTAPGSLEPDQVYSLVAWLLAENGVIDEADVMDATTLPAVRMPAHSRFVPDDRTDGPEIR